MTCYLHMPARPPALLPHLLPQAARGSSSSFTSDRGVLEWGKSQPRDKRPLASRQPSRISSPKNVSWFSFSPDAPGHV